MGRGDMAGLKTPSVCASPRVLAAFLRASRQRSDDRIRSELSERSCGEYIPRIFEEWNRRDELLEYCESLTQGESFEDQNVDQTSISQLSVHARDSVKFTETHTDPRVDSYGARDEVSIKDLDIDKISRFLHTQRTTEGIIRETTVDTVLRRCGTFTSSPDMFYAQYENFRE